MIVSTNNAATGAALLACSALAFPSTQADPVTSLGDATAGATTSERSTFLFTVTADAWFPRLIGDVPLGPGSSSINVDSLDLHGSEVSFSGSARLSWDRWFVEGHGFDFDTEGTSPRQAGIASASASWWSAAVDVGYALWRPFDDRPYPWSELPAHPNDDNRADDGAQRLGLEFAPTLGVAWDQIDIDTVATGGGHSGVDGGWGSVRFGLEMTLDLHTKDLLTVIDSVQIYAQGSVGPTFGVDGDGDGLGVVWWIDAGMRMYFTPNIAAHCGYRLIDGDFADDNSTDRDSLSVGLQGLVAGVTIRF